MKLAFSTLGCPDLDVPEVAARAAEYGFDGVELRTSDDGNHLHPDAGAARAAEVRRTFGDAGCEVFSLMAYPRFSVADRAERQKSVELTLRVTDLAAAVGARYVRVFAGQLEEGADQDEAIERVAEAIRPACRHAEEAGIRLAIETHDDWCRGEVVSALLRRVDSPALGVVWDFANVVTGGAGTLDGSFAGLKDSILYCHVKDAVRSVGGDEWTYVVPGEGEVGVAHAVEMLKGAGFGGYLSFEWEKKWHPELTPPEKAFPAYVKSMRDMIGD